MCIRDRTYGEEPTPEGRQVLRLIDSCMALLHTCLLYTSVFFSVIIPLSKPIMSTLAILQVISNWNAYLWPMVVIRDYKKQMISVGVALFNANQNAMYYGPRMAVAVLSAIPLVILYLILQKHIVASIAVTGIKPVSYTHLACGQVRS